MEEQKMNFCLRAYAARGIFIYSGIRVAASGDDSPALRAHAGGQLAPETQDECGLKTAASKNSL
jgi:hypothetical protein